jgi:hypothetical protein
MAAGLGFKDFVTGEVLTAADVDGYLMQGVWVFASAAARDAAVTSPQEGNFAYLKDTNVTTYYTGSAWANLDTTGMTNPMTTTGDMIYSSSGSTPARLGIGTASQQLRVNSGATAPEWFTPAAASSGMTLINTTAFSAVASANLNNVFSSTYTNYEVIVSFTTSANQSSDIKFRNGGSNITTGYYGGILMGTTGGITTFVSNNIGNLIGFANIGAGAYYWASLRITDVFTTNPTYVHGAYASRDVGASFGNIHDGAWQQSNTSTIDGLSININSGTITGTVSVYGLAK